MATLREIRAKKNLTQKEASEYLGVSLRSYKMYENEEERKNVIKYKYMVEQLEKYIELDEEHGILSFEEREDSNSSRSPFHSSLEIPSPRQRRKPSIALRAPSPSITE